MYFFDLSNEIKHLSCLHNAGFDPSCSQYSPPVNLSLKARSCLASPGLGVTMSGNIKRSGKDSVR